MFVNDIMNNVLYLCGFVVDLFIEKVWKMFVYFVIGLGFLLGNFFVIFIIFKICGMRFIMNYFILNMVVFDFFFIVFVILCVVIDFYLVFFRWFVGGVFGFFFCKFDFFI